MEEQILGITKLVNWLLGKPALALLAALHIHPENPQYPIPTHIAMEFLVFLLSIVFFLWLKARLSVDNPGGTQQCMEVLLHNNMSLGVSDLLESNIGHGSEKYLPMVASVGLYVLFCNLIGVVPGLASPTADKTVTLGCAVVVFLYYNWCGIRRYGPWRYAFTFLKMPVEIISHAARLLSLTVRLWVNMMVSEMLYVIFLGLTVALLSFASHASPIGYVTMLFPLVVPAIFIGLHIFVAFVQAFVFTILPVIYLSGAVSEGH